jgi:hypothetical protein
MNRKRKELLRKKNVKKQNSGHGNRNKRDFNMRLSYVKQRW